MNYAIQYLSRAHTLETLQSNPYETKPTLGLPKRDDLMQPRQAGHTWIYLNLKAQSGTDFSDGATWSESREEITTTEGNKDTYTIVVPSTIAQHCLHDITLCDMCANLNRHPVVTLRCARTLGHETREGTSI